MHISFVYKTWSRFPRIKCAIPIKKPRHRFSNKGLHSQSYGFSSSHVWMWELIIKKAECWRTNDFKLWCWRRLLSVPWTARRSNQSVLKEINPECSLEELILKLKVQYFGHLILFGKDPDAGKDWKQEEKQVTEDETVGWHHRLDGHEFEQALGDSQAWCAAVHGVAESQTRLSHWTTMTMLFL